MCPPHICARLIAVDAANPNQPLPRRVQDLVWCASVAVLLWRCECGADNQGHRYWYILEKDAINSARWCEPDWRGTRRFMNASEQIVQIVYSGSIVRANQSAVSSANRAVRLPSQSATSPKTPARCGDCYGQCHVSQTAGHATANTEKRIFPRILACVFSRFKSHRTQMGASKSAP